MPVTKKDSKATPKKNPKSTVNFYAARHHDIQVVTKEQEKRFKLWAKSFDPEVAEVLLTIDSDEWECNPARDTYVRFGWDRRVRVKDLIDWIAFRLEGFREMKFKIPVKVYTAALKQLKAAL